MRESALAAPAKSYRRIGLIVPSSNVTMETEIPALLKARETVLPDRFTFHGSRMRMKSVVKEELEAMDADSMRCATELSDAAVEVQAYACLVAIMSMGLGYHRASSEKLHRATVENGCAAPVLNSAGALVEGMKEAGVKKVALICPYMKPLTKTVVDYIENEGIEVQDALALEIPDNLQVAAQDPAAPADLWRKLDLRGVDAIVASACVQMPSLPAIERIHNDWSAKIKTSELNDWLSEKVAKHPPPAVAGRRVKPKYISQTKTRPPTFVLKCSRADKLPDSYKRYLINGLREDFDLPGIPIRLIVKSDDNPYHEKNRTGRQRRTPNTSRD